METDIQTKDLIVSAPIYRFWHFSQGWRLLKPSETTGWLDKGVYWKHRGFYAPGETPEEALARQYKSEELRNAYSVITPVEPERIAVMFQVFFRTTDHKPVRARRIESVAGIFACSAATDEFVATPNVIAAIGRLRGEWEAKDELHGDEEEYIQTFAVKRKESTSEAKWLKRPWALLRLALAGAGGWCLDRGEWPSAILALIVYLYSWYVEARLAGLDSRNR